MRKKYSEGRGLAVIFELGFAYVTFVKGFVLTWVDQSYILASW